MEREGLLGLAPSSSRRAGEVLIHQGDQDRTDVYLLRSLPGAAVTACVKVVVYLESGAEVLLGIRVGGDVVGELAALRRRPRSAMVTTCSPMLVHVIRAQVFVEFLDRHPAVWNAVTRMVADRLEWANRRRIDYAQHSVPVRVAKVLLEIGERYGVERADGRKDLGVELTHAEIASMIGAGKDAVFKAMRGLKDAGLIDSVKRRRIVLDQYGLSVYQA